MICTQLAVGASELGLYDLGGAFQNWEMNAQGLLFLPFGYFN